jgi:alpha-amylase
LKTPDARLSNRGVYLHISIPSNADPGQIRMFVGKEHVGETWTDVLGWSQDNVKIDEEGFGEFNCPGISMSIVSGQYLPIEGRHVRSDAVGSSSHPQYVNEKAEGRNKFGKFDDDIYKGEKLE